MPHLKHLSTCFGRECEICFCAQAASVGSSCVISAQNASTQKMQFSLNLFFSLMVGALGTRISCSAPRLPPLEYFVLQRIFLNSNTGDLLACMQFLNASRADVHACSLTLVVSITDQHRLVSFPYMVFRCLTDALQMQGPVTENEFLRNPAILMLLKKHALFNT